MFWIIGNITDNILIQAYKGLSQPRVPLLESLGGITAQ